MPKIEGIYLRKDLKEYITESFVKRYSINLNNWIEPFAYWDQYNQSVLSNGSVPDGTYVLLGNVKYPSVNKLSFHNIYQFNVVRLLGSDVTFSGNFNEYVGLSKSVPLRPVFPLFKLDQARSFNKARNVFIRELNKPLTHLELNAKIEQAKPGSITDKLYRLRLALETDILKEK